MPFFSASSARDFYAYLGTTQWIRVGVVLAVVLLAIGYAVGFAIASENAKAAADEDYQRRFAVYSDWQMDVVSQFTRSEALAATVANYAVASAYTPMNYSAPAADRMIIDNPAAFQSQCNDLRAELQGVRSVVLLPGGVASQICPENSIEFGLDLISSSIYQDDFDLMFEVGGPVVTGPNAMVSVPGGIAINAWYPIFVNSSTVPRGRETFWGAGLVIMEMKQLILEKDIVNAVIPHGLDFVVWWTEEHPNANGSGTYTTSHVIQTNAESDAARDAAMNGDMIITLPVSEPGKKTLFSLYPKGGPLKNVMDTNTIVMIALIVLVGDAIVIAVLYLVLYALFTYRHRRAPADGTVMFAVAVTLRGAQPIAERAPLESVRMFTDFLRAVRRTAQQCGCYPVAEIGDRSFLIVATSPEAVVKAAQRIVFDVSIHGVAAHNGAGPPSSTHDDNDGHSDTQEMEDERSRNQSGREKSYSQRSRSQQSNSQAKTRYTNKTKATTEHATSHSSSFIGTAICRPSAAMTVGSVRAAYDPLRDAYFFGNSLQLGGLCQALDGTKGGEVGWTADFEEDCSPQCRALEHSAVSTHIISEGDRITLHVASLWKETGDERDNEDPSVAMAVVTDAYIKKMTSIVADGRAAAKAARKKKRGDNNSSSKNSSDRSADAASITRNATILHIAILDDSRMPLDIIRRIVAEEKGAVVSGHENVLVAAFNLLTPGGHHQVRAADTVMRLRAALPSTPFVSSLHYGKVNALVINGLVLCSGDAVSTGRALLTQAVSLRAVAHGRALSNTVACGLRQVHGGTSRDNSAAHSSGSHSHKLSVFEEHNGMCVLLGVSELSSTYDCEAIDVTVNTNAGAVSAAAAYPLGCGYTSADSSAGGFASTDKECSNSAVPPHLMTVKAPAAAAVVAHHNGDQSTPTAASSALAPPRYRVVYRLAARKSAAGKNGDDEWMYRLKDEEDASPFAAVNAVFNRIAANDSAEAARIWSKIQTDPSHLAGISTVAIVSIERYLHQAPAAISAVVGGGSSLRKSSQRQTSVSYMMAGSTTGNAVVAFNPRSPSSSPRD